MAKRGRGRPKRTETEVATGSKEANPLMEDYVKGSKDEVPANLGKVKHSPRNDRPDEHGGPQGGAAGNKSTGTEEGIFEVVGGNDGVKDKDGPSVAVGGRLGANACGCKPLCEMCDEIKDRMDKLEELVRDLGAKNEKLREELESIKRNRKNEDNRGANSQLMEEVSRLRDTDEALKKEIVDLGARNEKMISDIAKKMQQMEVEAGGRSRAARAAGGRAATLQAEVGSGGADANEAAPEIGARFKKDLAAGRYAKKCPEKISAEELGYERAERAKRKKNIIVRGIRT